MEVIADATGAVPYRNEAGSASAEDIQRVYGVVLHSRFGAVVSTAQWIAALEARQPLARGSIHASHQVAVRATRE